MRAYLILLAGIVCAGIGGELFVRGAVGLARWARISTGIIGATVAAFATSSPELSVGVLSALAGTPQISLGDALGSNVLNIGLVLGLTLLLGSMRPARIDLRRDLPTALLVPVFLGLLALDGILSRLDGLLLLLVFLAWMVVVIIEVRRQRSDIGEILGEVRGWRTIATCLMGLVLLIAAGRFIVTGAEVIAIAWGLDTFVIGAVVVAIGTSVPELATSLIARVRGHEEVGLGTVLGSNIYNGLFIVAVVALLAPITVTWREISLSLLFSLLTLIAAIPNREGTINRYQGVLMLLLYVGYVAAILTFAPR
jgi:cation:H+ antiporter